VTDDHRHPWTFLTHHAQVLLAAAQQPDALVRDIAAEVGITPRAALTILGDLEGAGYLERERVGRRNRYTVHPLLPLRHPAQAAHAVGDLLTLFRADDADTVGASS